MTSHRPARAARSAALAVAACAGLALPLSPARAQQGGEQPRRETLREARESPAARIEVRRDRILLRQRPIETSASPTPMRTLVREARAPSRGRAVIQLDGPMNPDRMNALTRAGVRIGEYLPPDAFIADLSRADEAVLRTLDFVRWQGRFEPAWKKAPDLGARDFQTQDRLALAAQGRSQILITLFEGEATDDAAAFIRALPGAPQVHRTESLAGNAVIAATVPTAHIDAIADRPEVQFIEDAPELTDRSNTTTRWVVQSNVNGVTPLYAAGIRGENQVIGIIDGSTGGLDMDHCSFRDDGLGGNTPGPGHRKVLAYNTALGKLQHATHVSGTAAGDAGADNDTRGIAYNAKIVYGARPVFQEMSVYDAFALHHSQGARLHTNSWGDDSLAWYSSMCRGLDSFSYDNEDDLVCFAVTNLTNLRTPENAKNVLAVGASLNSPSQNSFCSGGFGPTGDLRRKPEIFAPGCLISSSSVNTVCSTVSLTGTSMACPAITGTAALARQYYLEGFYPSGTATPGDAFTPSGALLKATLLNSAVDMTNIAGYPSDQEGWGRVLADNTLYFSGDTADLILRDVRNIDGLVTGESATVGVSVLSSTFPLRVTLVWTDPPAAAGADVALVNDLDLEVISPAGQVYRGNVFAAGFSAVGGSTDTVNNVEQVALPAPTPGNWTVRVRASGVNVGAQGYALVVTADAAETLAPLAVTLSGFPSVIEPGCGPTITLSVNEGDDALVPGTVRLFRRTAGAGPFTEISVSPAGPLTFTAALPPTRCSDDVEIYAIAEGAFTGVVADPPEASGAPFTAIAVAQPVITASDDFESADPGWTVGSPGDTASAGIWTRVIPIGTSAQPAADHTADPGAFAWITGQHTPGQADGFNDVDGGATSLVSPVFDLTGSPSASVSYYRWFYTTNPTLGEDTFTVSVSNDNGANWTTVEQVGAASPLQALGGWFHHSFRPADFIAVTSTMRVRFRAADAGGATLVEAGVDDWTIIDQPCVFTPCEGDANTDGVVDFNDIIATLSEWGSSGAPNSGLPGDADGNGEVDFNDIVAALSNWLTLCCP